MLLLAVLACLAYGALLLAEHESRWSFVTTVIAGGLINPTIRCALLYRGVMRPASAQTPKEIQVAEELLILAHMFRVMVVCLAPFAIACVVIEMPTSGNHGVASTIATMLSGIILWAGTIAVTWYMVQCSQRDLDRLYVENPPAA